MLYNQIKEIIDEMIEEVYTGKEECKEVMSYHLIRDQNVPITIDVTMIYPLGQIRITLFCPFLLVDPDVKFEEIFKQDVPEDEFRLMRLIARFSTLLERLKEWIHSDVPEMIRWGEGVIFDKNGRTKKIPLPVRPDDKKLKNKR
ncbi:MAG: hypothetical protein MJB14_10005 [Spirochaetes bacterium]|nr:hypothetical protein [Spirochaetota bacterium]